MLQLGQTGRNGQSQAAPLDMIILLPVKALKLGKYLWKIFFPDSHSRILHLDI